MAPHHAQYFQRHAVASPPVDTLAEQARVRRNRERRVAIGCALLFAGFFWLVVGIIVLVRTYNAHHP